MSDKGGIIKEVCAALDGMLEETADAGPDALESRPWWTNHVLTTLCTWGLAKGFSVGASGMQDNERLAAVAQQHGGEIGGEWLYNFTCLKYTPGEWLKRIPLVAECEWNIQEKNQDEVNKDFEKLLLARADVRLMVFNGNPYRDGRESIPPNGLIDFRTYIKKCEHTCVGDTYLFAARLHDNENGESVRHRFDYHMFVA